MRRGTSQRASVRVLSMSSLAARSSALNRYCSLASDRSDREGDGFGQILRGMPIAKAHCAYQVRDCIPTSGIPAVGSMPG